MLPPGLQSPREVFQHYESIYDQLIDSGEAVPFTYPGISIGALIALVYLLIDHRQSPLLKKLRWPVFACLCGFQIWCVITNRARNIAAGFGVGLLSAFGVLFVFSIMIVNDCQTDFQRIERSEVSVSHDETAYTNDSTADRVTMDQSSGVSARQGKRQPGSKHVAAFKLPSPPTGPLYWQSYPSESLTQRITWVTDLFSSLRGVGWSWQTSGIPPPPKWVDFELRDGAGTKATEHVEPCKTSRTGIRRYSDRSALLQDALTSLVVCYFALDVIRAVMHHDPHFWGYTDCPGPSHLPATLQNSPVLLKSYRLLTQLAGIYTALRQVFALGPIFFSGILGPAWYGVSGESWMNPANMFGSLSFIGEQGLAGWWGGWWHQTFRSVFEPPATWVLQTLDIDKRSTPGKAIAAFVAFSLSGFLHAAGSYTQLGDNHPLRGPTVFFLLQFLGVMAETLVKAQLKRSGISQRTPRVLKQVANYIIVLVWMYLTAPFLVDDFAQGGIWLHEPVPFSLVNALGYGAEGDSWWCWQGLVQWRWGKGWYDTGFTL